MSTSIAFIGGGNMASSLIGGLTSSSEPPENILVSEPNAEQREQLTQKFDIQTTGENTDSLKADVVVLAVKPQLLQVVCRELSKALKQSNQQPLFISIAAGVRSEDIDRWLGGNQAIVRCMPNTPSLLQTGATGLYANPQVNNSQKALAENILRAVGITLWVNKEDELDAVTAVSGSGPAYFFLLMETMQQAGIKLGLEAETAEKLVLQTALGAALMAKNSDVDAATLRARVTSKGGTTEQAIKSFQNADFEKLVENALKAASDRSQTLADELSKDSP
ncbi:MAG: pyrroline-5-carboxylate reductase [Gammaproteobacteria bacterium]|nr:pyrroline-5-carboxylate reductase [Gammaproteobacteria bacterium]MCK5262624.1 pyrroline-5-carboxylate reductase [Gammaproteobacteria bacterium]